MMQRFPRQGYGCSVRRSVSVKRRTRRAVFILSVAGLLAGVGMMGRASGLESVQHGTAHEAWFDVDFHQDNGLAVGAAGALLRTGDGGRSWRRQRLDKIETAVLGVAVQADRILAVGQDGVILLSENEDRWRKLQSPTDARLFAVAAGGNETAAAVGEFGVIVVSDDGGQQWRQVPVDWETVLGSQGGLLVEPHLYAVDVDNAGAITVGGEFGLIMRSADQGGEWTVLHQGEASIFSLEFIADGPGYAVGQDGFAAVTHDGGDNWTPLAVGSEANLLDISASTTGEIVISGVREFWLSADHGRSWSRINDAEVDRMWFQAIARNDADEIYVVGQGASVLKLNRRAGD